MRVIAHQGWSSSSSWSVYRLEVSCSKSEASSIWQLLWKSREKKGWLPIMMSRRRAGEEELSCWLPLPRESIYVVCMNPTEHMTRMPFNSDLCLIVLIYSISAVAWLLNLMWPSLFWWPSSVLVLGTGWNGMKKMMIRLLTEASWWFMHIL